MNKPVQIVILLALLPLPGLAREETLEERKQRIVRKYLREQATITQSDMIVPSDLPEDERITDSEKFKTAEGSLDREESIAAPVLPAPRPVPVPRADANWLLGDAEEIAELDMFGNPVEGSVDTESDFWSAWSGESETSKKQSRSDRRYDPYNRGDERSAGREEQSRSYQQESRFGGSSYSGGTDIFGRRQTQPESTTGFGVQDTTRSYGFSTDQGLLTSPYQQMDENGNLSPGLSEKERLQGFQPYKSPYSKREEQRQQNSWSTQQGKEQNEQYQRQDSYQQWKNRQNEYDPTADDAYINQMMQKNRR